MFERGVHQTGSGEDAAGWTRPDQRYFESPTPREAEILALSAEGYTSGEIGKKLYLSTETVKSYHKKIKLKLGARNAVHAVVIAIREGFIRVPDE